MRFAKGIDFKHCPKLDCGAFSYSIWNSLEAPQAGLHQEAMGSRQEDDLSFQGGGHLWPG
jgi:hypothetical protein